MGQQPMSAAPAETAACLPDLDADVQQALRLQPARRAVSDPAVVTMDGKFPAYQW
jgi:hypothetical protein